MLLDITLSLDLETGDECQGDDGADCGNVGVMCTSSGVAMRRGSYRTGRCRCSALTPESLGFGPNPGEDGRSGGHAVQKGDGVEDAAEGRDAVLGDVQYA